MEYYSAEKKGGGGGRETAATYDNMDKSQKYQVKAALHEVVHTSFAPPGTYFPLDELLGQAKLIYGGCLRGGQD